MKYLVTTIFLLFNVIFMLLYYSSIGIMITFLINLILLTSMFYIIIKKQEFLLFDICVFIFHYLFFFVAPIIQSSELILPNTMEFNIMFTLQANLYITIFLTFYILFRFFVFKETLSNRVIKIPKYVFYILYTLNIVLFVIFFKYIVNFILLRTSHLSLSLPVMLIIHKFLFMIPMTTLLYLIRYKKNFSKLNYRFLVITNILLLLFFKNPFVERRFSIGVVYLTFFFLYLNKKKFSNFKILSIMFILIFLIFPYAQLITHTQISIMSLSELNLNSISILNEYRRLHYDAWSNFQAIIEYVSKKDFTYGRQIMGSVLFFIPKSIWENKPINTGHMVGNYLIDNYYMWFNNLSAPLIGEFYIDFGLIGIIIISIVLAFIGCKLVAFNNEDIYLLAIYIYISLSIIAILRGPLMSSFAYLAGNLLAIYYVPKFISKYFYMKKNIN